MSRYVDIEGDWVDEAIKTYSLGYYDYDEYAIPFDALGSAPGIEIIHCRECKRNADNGGLYDDGRTKCPIQEHYALPQDGFCHLGERSRR